MKRAYLIGPIVAAVLIAPSAYAEPGGTGFDLGARVGYGIPLGEASENSDLSDGVSGQIPLWLDVGYRLTPNFMLGAYFQYGFGFVPEADALGEVGCPPDADCSASDIRLGVQAQYRFSPQENINPWVGLGFGYEWLSWSAEAGGAEISQTGKGFEFVNLQGGADFKVGEGVGIGPFLSFSLGQFDNYSMDCPAGFTCPDGDIENKGLHEWLVIGARGQFSL